MKLRTTAIVIATATMGIGGLGLTACSKSSSDTKAAETSAAVETSAAAETSAATETTAAAGSTAAAETTMAAAQTTTASAAAPATGAGITLAVNPWTGSAVNANIAKVVLESKLGTQVALKELDENASWAGLDAGDIDANLEVWPSGHAKEYATYVTGKKSVADIGKLGPKAKIGWYITSEVATKYPALKTWEGFKDPAMAKLFATAESGDQGQFLMGDPSYVSYDEQIIKNLNLPLKFVVAGSEAAEITQIQSSIADGKPLLFQFWQPQWLQSKIPLTEVKLPDVTPACLASAAAKDGKYACDYPIDELYKVASAKLAAKNATALKFLSTFSLTTAQQNEVAAKVDNDKEPVAQAAKEWVDANAATVDSWVK